MSKHRKHKEKYECSEESETESQEVQTCYVPYPVPYPVSVPSQPVIPPAIGPSDDIFIPALEFSLTSPSNATESKVSSQQGIEDKITTLAIAIPDEVTIFRQRLWALQNIFRQQNGLSILQVNVPIRRLAQLQSQYMADVNVLVHTNNLGQKATNAGYPWSALGENIGYVTYTGSPIAAADLLFSLWINSPSHRANILNPAYVNFGIGFARSANGRAWSSVIFGRPL